MNQFSLSIVNLNLFANVADRLGRDGGPAWAKGLRLSLGVSNLFNQLIRVRDDAGATPLAFQGPYLDPIGRSANLSLRKLF